MLRSSEGANIEEIMNATGWQSHTVRGGLAGGIEEEAGPASRCSATESGRAPRLVGISFSCSIFLCAEPATQADTLWLS